MLKNILLFILCLVPLMRADDDTVKAIQHSELPEPVSNNAVAGVTIDGTHHFFSFMGLKPGKTYKDITLQSYHMKLNEQKWERIPPVPGQKGRLAGTAVGAGKYIYVFGGYTVAEDHSEKSIPDVDRYNPKTQKYKAMAPMPVPVDDAVSLLYKKRYIYLISGWHDIGNVDLVQVYDIEENRWFRATPYPGTPVFGHAGGIVNRTLIIADGVKKVWENKNKNKYSFKMSKETYKGVIDADDTSVIHWEEIPKHPGKARYRMAAAGSKRTGMVVFAGGSETPYNYNGIGYNGQPSKPTRDIFAWNVAADRWQHIGQMQVATMDHRGLLEADEQFFILGGMQKKQQVSNEVIAFELPSLE